MKELDDYPPMYQLQIGVTRERQMAAWQRRVLQFCGEKRLFLLDSTIVSGSSLFKSSDGRYEAEKQLQLSVFKAIVASGRGFWADDKEKSVYIYCVDEFEDRFLRHVVLRSTDDINTIQEVQESLRGSEFEKMPMQMTAFVLGRLGCAGRVGLIRDQAGKLEGVKLQR